MARTLTNIVHFKVDDGLFARLVALSDRFGLPLAVVARRALELGIRTIEENHAAFMRSEAEMAALGHEEPIEDAEAVTTTPEGDNR